MPLPRRPPPAARPPARRRRLITAAGRVGGAMAGERHRRGRRRFARRAFGGRPPPTGVPRRAALSGCGSGCVARSAAGSAARAPCGGGGAWGGEFSACSLRRGAGTRRLRQRSGWAQWAAHEGGGGARAAANISGGCRDVRSCVAVRRARDGCDWLAASEGGKTRQVAAAAQLRRWRRAARGGTRSASGWRRAPTDDATKDRARVGGVVEAMYAAYRSRQLLLFGAYRGGCVRCWRERRRAAAQQVLGPGGGT